MLGDMKDKFCLKDMVKFFIKTQPDVKKFWKKKSKDLTKKYELQNINEDEVSESEVKPKLLNKKQKRQVDEEVEEEKVKVKTKTVKSLKKQAQEENSDEEDLNSFAAPKNVKQSNGNGVVKEEKTPFKRIDNSLREVLPETLKDNSYDSFMYKTGENYGQQANDKLKFTKGRDFKKEKTKFKNKTAFGGLSISTAVRSICLDDD